MAARDLAAATDGPCRAVLDALRRALVRSLPLPVTDAGFIAKGQEPGIRQEEHGAEQAIRLERATLTEAPRAAVLDAREALARVARAAAALDMVCGLAQVAAEGLSRNADPKPFRWAKTADDILASIARFCHRTLDVQAKCAETSESGH